MGSFRNTAAIRGSIWVERASSTPDGGAPRARRARSRSAAGLGVLCLVLGASFVGGGQASAETAARAKLSTSLSGATGSSAAAYYVESGAGTTVVKWPGTYVYGSHAAGTPCSTYDLPAGATTDRMIHASGNYRKCV